jgi:hypothetical protein
LRKLFAVTTALAFLALSLAPPALAQGKPELTVVTPTVGQTVTNTDIPVQLQIANFRLAPLSVGLPDKAGEGHIHVMIDGMNMGVLFNFYTTTSFTLPGTGVKPGPHTLIFDLASNTHVDMEDTVKQVKINYQPTTPRAAPAAANPAGPAAVQVLSPANGTTVGPQFTIAVKPTNFTPAYDLEGKPNLAGYGHYHVWVDMAMSGMSGSGSMMSMAGLIAMPGSNSIPVNLSAWPAGKHTITIELVHNDHTPLAGAQPAMFTVNLQEARAPLLLPVTGSDINPARYTWILAIAAILLGGGILLRALLPRRS